MREKGEENMREQRERKQSNFRAKGAAYKRERRGIKYEKKKRQLI